MGLLQNVQKLLLGKRGQTVVVVDKRLFGWSGNPRKVRPPWRLELRFSSNTEIGNALMDTAGKRITGRDPV